MSGADDDAADDAGCHNDVHGAWFTSIVFARAASSLRQERVQIPHPFPKIRNRVPCPDTKCAVIYYSHDMMKVCCDRRQLEDDSVHKAP